MCVCRINGFTLNKKQKAETRADANYVDDLALLAIMPLQAESLLHSLEQKAGGIGLYMNKNKIVYVF